MQVKIKKYFIKKDALFNIFCENMAFATSGLLSHKKINYNTYTFTLKQVGAVFIPAEDLSYKLRYTPKQISRGCKIASNTKIF